ncbi:hypothetical protein C8R43DRAFT_994179 [Mycena crocata]|nr:hypothetical protein C8R43DRAFT_994179 [Mycena crocata]
MPRVRSSFPLACSFRTELLARTSVFALARGTQRIQNASHRPRSPLPPSSPHASLPQCQRQFLRPHSLHRVPSPCPDPLSKSASLLSKQSCQRCVLAFRTHVPQRQSLSYFSTMSRMFGAMIRAEDNSIYSKFKLQGKMWVNGQDQDEGTVPITFNCNSDVAVPRFWSEGSNANPPGYCLIGRYDNWATQGIGHDEFRGTIGEGKIFLKTSKGVVIKGSISGGPATGQTIVGAGTWIMG